MIHLLTRRPPPASFAFIAATLMLSLAAAEPPGATAPVPPGTDERELREVLDLLKGRFANPDLLRSKELGNAAVEGIIEKLGPGAAILDEPEKSSQDAGSPVKTEVLPHLVGYWRLNAFKPPAKGWEVLTKQLTEWQKGDVSGLVLDMRDFKAVQDFEGATQIASFFVPGGTPLFSVQGLQIPQEIFVARGHGQPAFTKPLVILMNRQTAGAAEALAASLRASRGAILVGRSSAAQAAKYIDLKLQSGRYLRLAAGEVVLADGTRIFGQPLTPDIAIYIDDANEQKALAIIESDRARAVAGERQARRRISEAALVRDENPEFEEALARRLENEESKEPKSEMFLQDVALVRAMDVIRVADLAKRHAAVRAKNDDW